MKKKKGKLSNGIRFIGVVLISILVSGCSIPGSSKSGHKVKDIRKYKSSRKDVDKHSAMVRPLFMTSAHPNIALPYKEGVSIDPKTGAAVTSEQVTFTHADNSLSANNAPIDTTHAYELSEVTVTAKSRFTPEHDGKVNVDFEIRVPKELLSKNWRLMMTPNLYHNDSLVELPAVILKGEVFADRQAQDYVKYDEYLKSIIPADKYDSIFLDHKAVAKDLKNRREFYYQKYFKEWSNQLDYELWKAEWENSEAFYLAKSKGYKDNLHHKFIRQAQEQAAKDLALGLDTTGIYESYMDKWRGQIDHLPESTDKRDIDPKVIPGRFLEIHETKRTFNDIPHYVLSENDSIDITLAHYNYNQIAQNEIKADRKLDKFEQLVPFPYESDFRLDTIITEGKDFVFFYKQDYPVATGLKKLNIVLDTKVSAIDRSQFDMASSDTISYYIASLAQLADTSLFYKHTTLHRDAFQRVTSYIKFAPGKWKFDINYKDNRDEMDKFLDVFYKLNTQREYILDSVLMVASNSLEGDYSNNASLASSRIGSIKDYLATELAEDADVDYLFKTDFVAEDWNTLAKEIQNRNDMPNKSEILDMLSQAVNPDQTEADIKKRYPNDYKVMKESIYPLLNKVDFLFELHRPNMKEGVQTETKFQAKYAEGVRLMMDREYWKAMEILGDYPDYNAALCLACLGYNGKSYELLEQLDQNGNTEYLFAIVAARLGKKDEAVEHLFKAFELDPSKIYRSELDPEISSLIREMNLKGRIDSLSGNDSVSGDTTSSETSDSSAGTQDNATSDNSTDTTADTQDNATSDNSTDTTADTQESTTSDNSTNTEQDNSTTNDQTTATDEDASTTVEE